MNKHSSMGSKLYVQYGCGLCAPDGWKNFDSSPRLRFERLPFVSRIVELVGLRLFPTNIEVGDIVFGLSLPDNCADAVYASHVLEHLPRNDILRALANTFRLLKPGGVFRLVVPDLEWRTKRYMGARAARAVEAADEFITACNIVERDRARGAMALLRTAFGNSGHRWMYDQDLMNRLLEETGFVDIRRCEFQDSGDIMFEKVEDRGRFYDNGELELAMEGRKPWAKPSPPSGEQQEVKVDRFHQ